MNQVQLLWANRQTTIHPGHHSLTKGPHNDCPEIKDSFVQHFLSQTLLPLHVCVPEILFWSVGFDEFHHHGVELLLVDFLTLRLFRNPLFHV